MGGSIAAHKGPEVVWATLTSVVLYCNFRSLAFLVLLDFLIRQLKTKFVATLLSAAKLPGPLAKPRLGGGIKKVGCALTLNALGLGPRLSDHESMHNQA